MREAREAPKRVLPPFCEHCEHGWRYKLSTDPLYAGVVVSYVCSCPGATLMREKVEHYRQEITATSWWKLGEEAEQLRRAKALQDNPNKEELSKENTREVFYIPPSKRIPLGVEVSIPKDNMM